MFRSVVHHEQYDQTESPPLIEEYNAQLAVYYSQQTRNQHAVAWSGPIANKPFGRTYAKRWRR
ncbi:MAG: hypothetical protein H6667_02720 [Ardenticatenaceae bacterium]|nr:hypothetical protein [Ardenticatenaceae bacterium]MCB9445654.1 hypothetical protein [Ardenticatenaceae bacterium]